MRTLLLSLLVGGTALAVPPATFTGTITDTECTPGGHARMRMGETDAECAKACAAYHGSAYVLEEGENVYRLSDQKLAERFAAQRVTVVGTLDATGATIQVESIAAAKERQPPAPAARPWVFSDPAELIPIPRRRPRPDFRKSGANPHSARWSRHCLLARV